MHDLTTGSLSRHLLKTSSFMLIAMVFQTLYALIDLYWVARLGTDARGRRRGQRQSDVLGAGGDADARADRVKQTFYVAAGMATAGMIAVFRASQVAAQSMMSSPTRRRSLPSASNTCGSCPGVAFVAADAPASAAAS
jgi:hypothetical protein